MKATLTWIVLIVVGCFPAAGQSNARPDCCAEKITQEKRQALWQKMQVAIREVDRNLAGVMGVAISDLSNGDEFLLRGDEIFPQASSIKIAVLAELYRQEQQAEGGASGKQRLNDVYVVRQQDLVADSVILSGLTPGTTRITNRDLATMMVAVSDNSAANVLIDRLGMENINQLLAGLGLAQTRLRRKMMDLDAAVQGRENVATPREMMKLLQSVYSGKVFNKKLTDDFFKMLSTGSGANAKGSPIVSGLPEGTLAASKPGELEAVRADSGIVFSKNRPFVICVMTTYLDDEKAGEAAIAKTAAAAFRYFDAVGRASEYGRVISPRNSR